LPAKVVKTYEINKKKARFVEEQKISELDTIIKKH